jgi:hypothetical protein
MLSYMRSPKYHSRGRVIFLIVAVAVLAACYLRSLGYSDYVNMNMGSNRIALASVSGRVGVLVFCNLHTNWSVRFTQHPRPWFSDHEFDFDGIVRHEGGYFLGFGANTWILESSVTIYAMEIPYWFVPMPIAGIVVVRAFLRRVRRHERAADA